MIFTIDFNSEEALYSQLCRQVIMSIACEDIREGDMLPSVRQLADEIGINMHTVNKAYTILRQEGYIKLDRRKGAVIALDIDRLEAIRELSTELRYIMAKAVCRNITPEEIHTIVDELIKEFGIS